MSELIQWIVNQVAPAFLVASPVTSYADQIYSMYKARSSAGFSLDIPLIMLVSSILKIFYWLGERYDTALLFQALLMICVQTLLLHVVLTNRPSQSPVTSRPFAGLEKGGSAVKRPYNFWQWRSTQPYWNFLGYYTVALLVLQVVLGNSRAFVDLQGYVALSIEALLPLPQIASNYRNKSCKGFRLSVLCNWLLGDSLKMAFFFMADSSIPWAFKLCGIFQACCDAYLGVQYWMYGEGQASAFTPMEEKELRLLK